MGCRNWTRKRGSTPFSPVPLSEKESPKRGPAPFRWTRLHDKDEFTDVPARFHQAMRLGGRPKGKCCVDDGLHRARFKKRPHVLPKRLRDRALLGDRSHAKRRTSARKPALPHPG